MELYMDGQANIGEALAMTGQMEGVLLHNTIPQPFNPVAHELDSRCVDK